MKFSRKIIALITSACLLFSMNSLTISGETIQEGDLNTVAKTAGDSAAVEKNNCALASNGGKMYLGEGASESPHSPVNSLNSGVVRNGNYYYWCDWDNEHMTNNDYPATATVGVEFAKEYSVEEAHLYFVDDGGGCAAPSQVILQYWDEAAGEFKNVEEQSQTTDFEANSAGNTASKITFKPVATTKLQAVMTRMPNPDMGKTIGMTQFMVFTKDWVAAKNNCALASNGGTAYLGPNTTDASHSPVSAIIDGDSRYYDGLPSYWCDWSGDHMNNNDYPEPATVGVEFAQESEVYEAHLYFGDDGDGCFPPSKVILQYWDEDQKKFVDVANQSNTDNFVGGDRGGDAAQNIITFDPVKTTKLQAVMNRYVDPDTGRTIALAEFEVYARSNCALTDNGGKAYLGPNTTAGNDSPILGLNDGDRRYAENGYCYWSDWSGAHMSGNDYPDPATVGVEFADEFEVDEAHLYLGADAPGGGCYAPAKVILQYWDEAAGEFKNVEEQSNTDNFTGSERTSDSEATKNVITFKPVRTKKLQAVMNRYVDPTTGRTIAFAELEVFTNEKVPESARPVEKEVVEALPAASEIDGVANPTILLNSSEEGQDTWEFLFETSEEVPAPTAENQDFDFSGWDTKSWQKVKVPGTLTMQGFDIKNNNEYYYRREVQIPDDYAGQNIILRFDAVYSNARVWVDGHHLRTHKGGFTTWEVDITDYATPGDSVTLVVGVADINGNEKGMWNPKGANLSDPSGAALYVSHCIGGITRDVNLEARSKDHVATVYTNTVFEDNYTKADLDINTRIYKDSEGPVSVRFDLYQDGVTDPVGTTTATFEDEAGALAVPQDVSIHVENPLLWDAEHPNLYTLNATVVKDGKDISTTTQRIGFRELTFGGANGTDSNKVYINGKEIKLRGVCRHDGSWETSRSMTKEESWKEIQDYKDTNINFIRTSHYQVSKHLLEACDALGIYVEEENASCWAPKNTEDEVETYMECLKEQIGKNLNHPSIIMWSLGNESTWAPMNTLGYKYVKSVDPTRMVIFSYPETAPDNIEFDIFSRHYANYSDNLGHPDMPMLHDEYAPPAAHHYVELQRDLNVRNAWSETVEIFWEKMFETDGCLGGAIWEAKDDLFFIPEGITKLPGNQGDSDGPMAGGGNWGVVRDYYQRLKPEAWLLKKAYSPIRVDEDAFRFNGENLGIPVKNWYNHTNFDELELDYSIDGGEVQTMQLSALAPHESGEILLSIDNPNAEIVNLKFYETDLYTGERRLVDEYNIELVVTTYEFIPASEEAPTLTEDDDIITISGDDFSVKFSKATGMIQEGKFQDDVLITGGPNLHATYIDFGKWVPAEIDGITAKTVENMAVITLNGAYENGQGVKFIVSISKNGIITTEYELTTDPEQNSNPLGNGDVREVGVSYNIPADMESVSWVREGDISAYPENHLAREVGTALKERPGSDENPDQYGVKPDWGWEMDMTNYALYAEDDPRHGIVTNDFKTMRENIWNYDVNYAGTDSRISVESAAEVAARVEVTPNWVFVDDRDPAIQYTGNWKQVDDHRYGTDDAHTAMYAYNNTETASSDTSATCTYTFEGTGINLITSRDMDHSFMTVSIDGGEPELVRQKVGWGCSKRRVLYSVNGLEPGEHTIVIKPYGRHPVSGNKTEMSIDGFGVMPQETVDQSAELIINQDFYYPNLRWGCYRDPAPEFEQGTTGSATIRLTNQDNKIPVKTAAEYVDVTDITNVPDVMFAGMQMKLNGSVVPSDATIQDITWTLKDAGTTGAALKGNVLSVQNPGVVIVTASVQNVDSMFQRDYAIMVYNNVAPGADIELGEGTNTENGRTVESMIDGVVGGQYWTEWNQYDYDHATYQDPAEFVFTLAEESNVSGIEAFFHNDGGGCFPPRTAKVQYWDDAEGAYKDVSNPSKESGFTGDSSGNIGNTIMFDPVTTTKLKFIMTHDNDDRGRAIAISELGIMGTVEMAMTGVEIEKLPDDVEYVTGEELDLTGLKVKVTYDNGYFKYVDAADCDITGFDSATAGKSTVTVSYTEGDVTKTASFEVTIKEKPAPVLNSITLTGPTQTEYFVGEELKEAGLVVTAHYSDGTSKEVTGYRVSGFDSTKAGKNTVTVSYTENGVAKTASFEVTIKEKPVDVVLESITLTGPTQTEYFVGEELKEAGLVVTAHYSNGSSRAVTGYQVSGFDSSKAGKNTVTVSYTEKGVAKTASFEVTIKEKPADAVLESITLKGPDKTEYKVGEGMDLKGLAVTAHYSDETSREVTGYQVSGFDSTKAGKITVTVSYTEDGVTKTAAFDLTVKETGGSSSGDGSSAGDGSSTGDGTTGDGTQTGDMAPIMLATAVMLLALGACLVLVLVRRAKIK